MPLQAVPPPRVWTCDDARLRVAELRRRGAGGHRGVFEAALVPTVELGARRPMPDEHAAAVARRYWHAVDVGHRLVGPAAADRDGPAPLALATTPGCKRQDVLDPVDRQLVDVVALEGLLRGHLVAGHQRVLGADNGDFSDFDGGLLEGEVLRDRSGRREPGGRTPRPACSRRRSPTSSYAPAGTLLMK